MTISHKVMLSDRERITVERIVRSFDGKIGEVKVFGSRVTTCARPSSDLDLVVFPPLETRELYDMMDAFEESDLPIFVDIVGWEGISSDRFRQQIQRHAVPLLGD